MEPQAKMEPLEPLVAQVRLPMQEASSSRAMARMDKMANMDRGVGVGEEEEVKET